MAAPVSRIVSGMPLPGRPVVDRGGASRITGIRRPHGSQLPVAAPTTYQECNRPFQPNLSDTTESTATTSDDDDDVSLTPTDEFMEDGLGGSSFLNDPRLDGMGRHANLSTDGYAALDPCLTDVLGGQPPAENRGKPAHPAVRRYNEPSLCEMSMDKDNLEGYVIVDNSGAG